MDTMEHIETYAPTQAELDAGGNWRTEHLTWKAGTRHNQMDGQTVDDNWCTGAAMANLWEGLTGQIESGKAIYRETRKRFAERLNESSQYGGASLREAGTVLLTRQGLEGEAQLVLLKSPEEVMAWLVRRGPVAFGCRWRAGMVAPRSYRCATWMEFEGSVVANHAACLVGTTHRRGGFVRIENSYGMQWGSKGLAWMRHEAFARALKQPGTECIGVRLPEHMG